MSQCLVWLPAAALLTLPGSLHSEVGGVKTTTTTTVTTVTTVEEGVPSVVDSNCTFNEFYAEGKSPESVVMAMPGEGQEITAEWLSGVINAPVTSCKSKAAAEGQTGVTFLITEIVYGEGLAADHMAPTSLAVKMHALTPEGRGFAILAKFYEKELFFFESE